MANTRVTNPVTDFDKTNTTQGLKLPSGTNSNQPTGVDAIQGMLRNDTEETVDSSASALAHYNGTEWRYFAATESPNPPVSFNLDYLVVAGGGAGGGSTSGYWGGAGGGAGGLLTSTGIQGGGGSSAPQLQLQTSVSYDIEVGYGGCSTSWYEVCSDGGNSSFSTIIATGGGSAKGGTPNSGNRGGSNAGTSGASAVLSYTTTPVQGHVGGASLNVNPRCNGGGGGAGAPGVAGTSTVCGAGGAGLTNDITGTSTYYAGGGGGAHYVGSPAVGVGGIGGGGNGSCEVVNGSTGAPGYPGIDDLGGGGGGCYTQGAGSMNGGTGGSGIVIIKYPNTLLATLNSETNISNSIDSTSSPGFIIHKFTQNTKTKGSSPGTCSIIFSEV